jgi:putative membrane protein
MFGSFAFPIVLGSIPLSMEELFHALVGTAAFGLLGLALMLLGFKLFEWTTRRLDVEKQLENQNLAVGIVVGALLLGISLIVVVSML